MKAFQHGIISENLILQCLSVSLLMSLNTDCFCMMTVVFPSFPEFAVVILRVTLEIVPIYS
jgi:hypothetical protein